MDENNFTVIFQKLESHGEQPARDKGLGFAEADREEIAEIAELRRIVLEITEPDPTSYTTT